MKRAILVFLLLWSSLALAAEKQAENKAPEFKPEFPKEVLSQTKHSIVLDGKTLRYTATAGNLLLKEEQGKPRVSFFFVAYTLDGVSDPATRPITYSFNGGPGSSSVWLHLGLLGPRRVLMNDDGSAPRPPYRLVDNEYSMLDVTDLVFIDPVTTGYTRAVPGQNPKEYYGVKEDIETVGEFIRLYTTRFQRWSSPKFLIGESYGTTRAAGLAEYMQERHGMYFNGVMLVSSILNWLTDEFDPGNDLPYALILPSYTATAWYHKKLPADLMGDLEKTLQQSEAFATDEYLPALTKGARLTDDERARTVEKLARFTGLSPQYIDQSNLRIEIERFTKQLLRDQRRTTGRLDSRFTGMDLDAAGETPEYDPSYAAIQGPFTAMLNQYVRAELKYESDLPYEILTGRVHPWKFDQGHYTDVAESLRQAITRNPHLKVFVANGYFDLATPFFATRYTFEHLGLEPPLRGNVTMGYYQAGHMMYINKPSIIQLKKDLTVFFRSAL